MLSINRMGIFIFYDTSGIVDQYVDVLLDSMYSILQELVIIINGGIKDIEYQKLEKYSQNIFIRRNYGFDAGGYKDAFTHFLSAQQLMQYDEIVLFNDTFYGPFYSWIDIFSIMEKENMDFWGLSRHPGGILQDNIINQHIQSFFLVCRKSLFESEKWTLFWNNLEYPKNIIEAILNFEVKFSEYFTRSGFTCKAFTDMKNISFEYNKNPYADYAYDLIKLAKFPILKKKIISLRYFWDVKQSLKYIADYTYYDVNLIYSNLKRLREEETINIVTPFKESELENFYYTHKKIYIYGYGYYGQGIGMYFEYRGWKYMGFLVTKKNVEEENVFEYGGIEFNDDVGIILALGKKALEEVLLIIKRRFKMSQLLMPGMI